MGSPNVEYLMGIHKYLSYYGYSSLIPPKMCKYIGASNKVYFSYKLRTYSYSSFTYLHNIFYPTLPIGPSLPSGQGYGPDGRKSQKIIPKEIGSLLSPLVLAIWIMDDGGRSGSGVRVSTQSFIPSDVKVLRDAINQKFGLSSTLQRQNKTYNIYFPKASIERLKTLVKPHFIPSMYYKLEI